MMLWGQHRPSFLLTPPRVVTKVRTGSQVPPLPADHPLGRGPPFPLSFAQVAELVDALASGASEQLARGGSSPLLGTKFDQTF